MDMDPDEAIAKLQHKLKTANADELITALATLALEKGKMEEDMRRRFIKVFSVRLATRILEPGFLKG